MTDNRGGGFVCRKVLGSPSTEMDRICRSFRNHSRKLGTLSSPVIQSDWRYSLSNRAHFWPADTILAVLALFVLGSTQFLQHFHHLKK